jgi:hypothetical protein
MVEDLAQLFSKVVLAQPFSKVVLAQPFPKVEKGAFNNKN